MQAPQLEKLSDVAFPAGYFVCHLCGRFFLNDAHPGAVTFTCPSTEHNAALMEGYYDYTEARTEAREARSRWLADQLQPAAAKTEGSVPGPVCIQCHNPETPDRMMANCPHGNCDGPVCVECSTSHNCRDPHA